MIIVDEYLAVRVILGQWPEAMPDDEVALPTMGHWRLLQALHNPRGGQLTRMLADVSDSGRAALRWPHPEVLQVLDSRPLLDRAAALAARFGGGWRNAEILAAGVANGNVGSGVSAWTLDDQEPNQKGRDRASIAHALAGVDRHLPRLRPAPLDLRAAADAICWAAGAETLAPTHPDHHRRQGRRALTRNTRQLLVRGDRRVHLPTATAASTIIIPPTSERSNRFPHVAEKRRGADAPTHAERTRWRTGWTRWPVNNPQRRPETGPNP
ncbi:MAG: hypothetical protein ACRDWW_06365 [Acidimicrobiales bacterium]